MGDNIWVTRIVCPHCGNNRPELYDTTPGNSRPPRVGDATLCAACFLPAVFDLNWFRQMTARKPTVDEDLMIRTSDIYRKARAALRESYDPLTAARLVRGETE